jgi:phosphatidylserine synthase
MMFTLKTAIITATPFVIAALVVYLFGSFGSASWNPVDWTANARWFCIMWACIWGLALWSRIEYKRGDSV